MAGRDTKSNRGIGKAIGSGMKTVGKTSGHSLGGAKKTFAKQTFAMKKGANAKGRKIVLTR